MATVKTSVNPAEELAYSEFKVEYYQAQMTNLENLMDQYIAIDDDSGAAREQIAEIRAQINLVRGAIGFWRAEISFWRESLNQIKLDVKAGNELAKGS